MSKWTRDVARSIALLAGALLLAGCDKDFATLTFENSLHSFPVRSGTDKGESSPGYHEQLKELVRAQGIDPAMVRTRIKDDEGHRLVLSEPIFGGLSPEQKARLQAALMTIIKARQAPMNMHVAIHPDAMLDTTEEVLGKAQGYRREYNGQFRLGDVSLSVAFGMGDVVDAVLKGSLKMQSEAFCNVTAVLATPLPLLELRALEDDRSNYHHALRDPSTNDRIPVEISFKETDLQSLISQGKVDLSSSLSDQDFRSTQIEGLSQFEFVIGSMGSIDHESSKVDIYSRNLMTTNCEEMASALGRPFSYKFGNSLDRLNSFVFY